MCYSNYIIKDKLLTVNRVLYIYLWNTTIILRMSISLGEIISNSSDSKTLHDKATNFFGQPIDKVDFLMAYGWLFIISLEEERIKRARFQPSIWKWSGSSEFSAVFCYQHPSEQ